MGSPNSVQQIIGSKILVDDNPIIVDLKKSQGSWLVDAATGNRYLDCFSQFASQPLGWNHPKMISQVDRLLEVALHKIANSDMLTEGYANFVETFSEFTQDFKYHFYISGGALAVENAIKAAFDWKMRKSNHGYDAAANCLDVIHLQEAFHGRSGYSLSLTNNGDPYNPKTWGFPKFDWSRVKNPKTPSCETESINEIKQIVKNGMVAALIIEPIQGEGGDNHFRKEYLTALRELADENDFLLIFDEVQTGAGMTGKFWCYEHFGIIPDIVCFGKKMQVCGICSTSRVDEVEDNVFKKHSRINSTWGSDLVDMVRSTMQLEIIRDDKLIENAREVGDYFLTQLRDASLPVQNIRGRGLMIAFDLESNLERNTVLDRIKKNVLALPCGKKSIRFRPHLTFSRSDVDQAMQFIKSSLT